MSTTRSWVGEAAAAAMAVVLALATSTAIAAPAAAEVRLIVPSAASLLRFYPAQLISTPDGDGEDQEVWLAKVQGLIATAPPLLQQSLLSSQTVQEFTANLALLEQMQEGTLKRGALSLKTQAKGATVETKALGDAFNLVYTALPPCRIMDSRNALGGSGVQGPLVGNHLYAIPGFITAGGNWGLYGGNPTSDCGLNTTVGFQDIRAIALVITILNPNFDAFLGVSNSNILANVLSSVALDYTHGQGLSTQYIVPQGGLPQSIYFAMPAALSANIIFDVVGYFAVSQATALQCANLSADGTSGMIGNTFFTIIQPSCATGYTQTGGGCSWSSSISGVNLMMESPYLNKACVWFNFSGTTIDTSTYHAESVCCRVPGR